METRHAAASENPLPNPTAGKTLRLAELSFTKISALDHERTVILFAVSPLEEHGPHLPVGSDLFHSEFFNDELAKRILAAKPDWTVVVGPSLPIGASAFDAPGTLLVRARTVRNAALDYGAALARHGFRTILVTNAHAGPKHVVALEEAAAVVSRRYGVRMFSMSGPVLWDFLRGKYLDRVEPLLGRPLSSEERKAVRGDSHGGLWETALLMLSHPELVEANYRSLPPVRFTFLEGLRKNYPLRLGNLMGYVGSPAGATKEFGEAARRILIDAVWEAVQPVFDVRDESWQRTSFFFKIPFFRSAFPYVAAGVGVFLGALALAWWLR